MLRCEYCMYIKTNKTHLANNGVVYFCCKYCKQEVKRYEN